MMWDIQNSSVQMKRRGGGGKLEREVGSMLAEIPVS